MTHLFHFSYLFCKATFAILKLWKIVYLQKLIRVFTPAKSPRSENSTCLIQPFVRTRVFGNTRFDVALWNTLPEKMRSETLTRFKIYSLFLLKKSIYIPLRFVWTIHNTFFLYKYHFENFIIFLSYESLEFLCAHISDVIDNS